MNGSLEESTSKRAAEHATAVPAVRTVRYPSIDFPVPPAVALVVPESWRPIGAAVINEMRTRPDVAVAGPEVVDGVRPSLMVKVSRIPVSGDGRVTPPTDVLRSLFARQRAEERAEGFEYRLHDAESGDHPYGVSRYTEHLGEVHVQRLTCAVIVATGPILHLVVVQAALSSTDEVGRSAIEAAFASLRVSPPNADAAGVEVDRG